MTSSPLMIVFDIFALLFIISTTVWMLIDANAINKMADAANYETPFSLLLILIFSILLWIGAFPTYLWKRTKELRSLGATKPCLGALLGIAGLCLFVPLGLGLLAGALNHTHAKAKSNAITPTVALSSLAKRSGGTGWLPRPNQEGAGDRIGVFVRPHISGLDYAHARSMLVKQGFIPRRAPDADCSLAGSKCQRFPELEMCSADGYCKFSWRSPDGTAVAVCTHDGAAFWCQPNGSSAEEKGAVASAVRPYQTTARNLYHAYKQNEVAEQYRIANRPVLITGKIHSIGQKGERDVVIKLDEGGTDPYIKAHMTLTQDAISGALQLIRGQTVTLLCKHMAWRSTLGVYSNIYGAQCSIVGIHEKIGAVPAQTTRLSQGVDFPSPEYFYPLVSQQLGTEGHVIVRLCIDADGKLIGSPAVSISSGSPRLDHAAIRYAEATSGHWNSARRNGMPVSACASLLVRFSLEHGATERDLGAAATTSRQ